MDSDFIISAHTPRLLRNKPLDIIHYTQNKSTDSVVLTGTLDGKFQQYSCSEIYKDTPN